MEGLLAAWLAAVAAADPVVHGPALPPDGSSKGAREWAEGTAAGITDDVYSPFVPTSPVQVDRLLALASVTAEDTVCDLGFGEAALLIDTCQRTKCAGVGVEINGALVSKARIAAADGGLSSPQLVLKEGLMDAFLLSPEFQRATVVFVFLVPQQLAQILPQLRTFLLRPGCRIISERYEILGLTQTGELVANGTRSDGGGNVSGCGVGTEANGYFGRPGAAYLYGAAG